MVWAHLRPRVRTSTLNISTLSTDLGGFVNKRSIGPMAVAEIGFGACLLSNEGRPDVVQAVATIHAALEAGAGLIDTADAYALS